MKIGKLPSPAQAVRRVYTTPNGNARLSKAPKTPVHGIHPPKTGSEAALINRAVELTGRHNVYTFGQFNHPPELTKDRIPVYQAREDTGYGFWYATKKQVRRVVKRARRRIKKIRNKYPYEQRVADEWADLY